MQGDIESERKRGSYMKNKIRILLCAVVVTVIILGTYFYLKYLTYHNAYVTGSYQNESTDTYSYKEFADSIFRYNKDGAALLDKKGKEIWSQPYQMANPMIDICKGTLVIGDKGGTGIFVFQKDGLKGEIKTPRPIERMTVSEQGIVGTVLKDGETPRVVCYDAKGSVLVEHKASLVNTGYPIDIAISQDGNMLLVSYLYVKGGSGTTKIVYYNFGKAGEGKQDHQVFQAEYQNEIIPSVMFTDYNTSVAVGDEKLLFFKGKDVPEPAQMVKIDKEIKAMAYSEEYVALVLKNSGKTGSELCLYNMNGKQTMSVNFEGEYNNIKITGNQVLLFDGNKCSIYNSAGVHKYEGELEGNILEMIPIMGFNKYLVISTNELQEVQLAN